MDMVLMVAVDLMHKQKFLPLSSLHIQLKIVELKVREGEKQNNDVVVIREGKRKGEREGGRWKEGGEREKERKRDIELEID